MDVLLAVVMGLGVITLSWVLLAILVVRVLVRGGRSLQTRARRERLRWSPGVPGEVERLRRELVWSVEASERALATARRAQMPEGDVAGLLHRVRMAARSCVGELSAIAGMTDPKAAQARLAAARAHVAEVRAAADDLTDGLAAAAAQCAAPIADLRRDCAVESAALRAGASVAHRVA